MLHGVQQSYIFAGLTASYKFNSHTFSILPVTAVTAVTKRDKYMKRKGILGDGKSDGVTAKGGLKAERRFNCNIVVFSSG